MSNLKLSDKNGDNFWKAKCNILMRPFGHLFSRDKNSSRRLVVDMAVKLFSKDHFKFTGQKGKSDENLAKGIGRSGRVRKSWADDTECARKKEF